MRDTNDASVKLLVDGLRTIDEPRAFTRLSRAMLYLLMERGDLAYTTIGRRRLIPHRALIELASRGLVGGGKE